MSNSEVSVAAPTVLVTGFGPFGDFSQNSSWITVKELMKLGIKDFNIVIKEIPVEYEAVSKIVPKLWNEYKPKLTIHCGMSSEATCLTLEQIAHNKSYARPDIQGKLPVENVCCCDGPNALHTMLDVHKVIDEVDNTPVNVKAIASEDAGRYLCEFIFYTSLKIDKNTAFIHVPPINKPYSARELAESLAVIIRSLLKQCINNSENCIA